MRRSYENGKIHEQQENLGMEKYFNLEKMVEKIQGEPEDFVTQIIGRVVRDILEECRMNEIHKK